MTLWRWRQRSGVAQLSALIRESLAVAGESGTLAAKDPVWAAADFTIVQFNNVKFPTYARLMHKAIVLLGTHGVPLWQSYMRVS